MFARKEGKLDFLINLEFQKDRQAFNNLDFFKLGKWLHNKDCLG